MLHDITLTNNFYKFLGIPDYTGKINPYSFLNLPFYIKVGVTPTPPPSNNPYFENIVLLLHMDGLSGSNTFIDNSTNSFIITPYGNAQINTIEKKFGNGAALFDGGGDYLTVPQIPFGTGDFTIECWVYLISRVSDYPTIFGNYNSFGAEAISIQAGHSASPDKYNVWLNGLSPALESTNNIQYNVWTHIAVTRSGNTIRLFIDGILNDTNTFSDSLNGVGSSISIGSPLDTPTDSINGYIDELRITKGVARYTTNFTPQTVAFPNPIDLYPNNTELLLHMDGTNGSTIFIDNSKNNLIVTAYGDTQVNTAQKKFGSGSGLFDGDGDYLEITDIAPFEFGSEDFTLECWLYIYEGGGGTTIARWGYHANAFFFLVNTSEGVILYLNNDFIGEVSGGTITPETWHHVCLVRNGTDLKTFIDGQQVGTTATFTDPIDTSEVSLRIGGDVFGNTKFNGYIDELRITKGIARYTSNFPKPEAPFANPKTGLSQSNAGDSAYQIKTDFPSSPDGLYWIKNANINGGEPFQIYADMTTLSGGWTLILNNYNEGGFWTFENAISANVLTPPSATDVAMNYSIIAWADYIKKSEFNFDYMFDANIRGYNGGIYTALSSYSFIETPLTAPLYPDQSGRGDALQNTNGWRKNISEVVRFPKNTGTLQSPVTSVWNYASNSIEFRMPFYTNASAYGIDGQAFITTNGNDGAWWGTLVTDTNNWNVAPWLGEGDESSAAARPTSIWYWVR